jgi:3',5'-cyclic AMP phosphodiesterase CpdA
MRTTWSGGLVLLILLWAMNAFAWSFAVCGDSRDDKDGISVLIVAMHIPPAPEGIRPHGTRYDYEERSAKLLKILKRHGVDAVLSGHEHMQYVENWQGVLLLISGGAGAPLAPFQRYGYYRIDVENGKLRETFQRVRPAAKTR